MTGSRTNDTCSQWKKQNKTDEVKKLQCYESQHCFQRTNFCKYILLPLICTYCKINNYKKEKHPSLEIHKNAKN